MKPFILSFLILLTFWGGPATASVLQEIRTGKYSDFTRIVFQFEAPVRYQANDGEHEGKLTVTFLNTASKLPENRLNEFPAPVEAIVIDTSGKHLVTAVTFSFPRYRLKSFTLTEPDRVVLDLYPDVQPKSQVVLNAMVIKASLAPTPVEDQPQAQTAVNDTGTADQTVKQPTIPPGAPQPAAVASEPKAAAVDRIPEPSATATTPVAQKPPQPAVITPPEPEGDRPSRERPAAKPGKFQQYLIAALAGISLVILALLGFLIFQKRNAAEKSAHVETREELKTTADIMATIDNKIKEKFKQYETSNPEETA